MRDRSSTRSSTIGVSEVFQLAAVGFALLLAVADWDDPGARGIALTCVTLIGMFWVLWQRRIGKQRWIVAEYEQAQTQLALENALRTLRLSEERFRLLSEAAPVGVFETDQDGCCIYANTAWREILQAPLCQNVDCDWIRSVHSDEREAIAEAWREALVQGQSFFVECRVARADGHVRWVQVRNNPMPSDAGVSFVGVLEDITDRKLSENELKSYAQSLHEARERLAQDAERLSQLVQELEHAKAHAEQGTHAKSEFLANMSHEIRTPMTAVLGYTDLLLEQTIDQPQLQDSLQIVKRNAEFLLDIINDILDLSKIEAGKIEIEQVRCSPRQLASDVLA